MGGFTGQPPTQSDWDLAAQGAIIDAEKRAQVEVEGFKKGGILDTLWAKFRASGWAFLMEAISWFTDNMDKLLAIAAKFFTAAQGTNSPGFFQLTAAIIEDLLGVEVTAADMESSFRKGGSVAGARAIGGKLFDQLTREFSPAGELTPDSGMAAAKAFLGFLMAFAIRQGNVAFISEFLPEEIDFVKGIREYGELMAENLGLGRMARRALQPLIQVLISDPITWKLNNQYRPTLLSDGQALRAYARGALSESETKRILAWHGIPDAWLDILLQDSLTQLTTAEIHDLNRFGRADDQAALKLIEQTGTSNDIALMKLTATRLKDADSAISEYISLIKTQRIDGFIDAGTFRSLLDTLPISQEQKNRTADLVGQTLEFPRVTLTLAEMQTAFANGIVDLSEMQDFFKRKGYSDDDSLTLQYLTLLKLDTLEARKAVAQFAWDKAKAKAQAKGLPEPPMPAILAS